VSEALAFVPHEMAGFASRANGWSRRLREEAGSVDDALDRLRATSSEFVPALAGHEAAVEELADRVLALSESVGALGAAAEEADRQGIRGAEVLSLVRGGVELARNADRVVGINDAVQQLLRFSLYSLRASASGVRLLLHERRYGPRAMPSIASARATMPGGATAPRGAVRVWQIQLYRALKDAHRANVIAYQNARRAMHARPPLTPAGQHVRRFFQHNRYGRVLRVGGKALGGVGVGIGVYDAAVAARSCDAEGAIVAGASALGGGMMLLSVPGLQLVGGVVVLGALVYENREWIGDRLDDAGEAITSAAQSVQDGADEVLAGARRLVGGLF